MVSGIVIVISASDWLFGKGALASCRYFMPDRPVTMFVDGEIDTTAAERAYGLEVIDRNNVTDPRLRKHGFGWGTTKLLAFWYGRSETFLYLDSDAVVWGDLSKKASLYGFDYLVSVRNCSDATDDTIETWFFEIPFVEKHFPGWKWRKSAPEFFCPGVFAGRKSAIDLDEYARILELNDRHPGAFKFGDMGFHNVMVFEGRDKGRLRVDSRDFQVIFPDHPMAELEQRFRFSDGVPVVVPGDEQVLHMPDKKPLVDSTDCYSAPMTFFRLKYLEDTEGITGNEAMACLRAEDAQYHVLRKNFLRRGKLQKVARLARGHWGEWRRVLRSVARTIGNRRTRLS